jgi:transposase InsO family protein
MAEDGLQGRQKRGFRKTTDSNHAHRVAPNVLDRDFTAAEPNEKWVGDISVPQKAAGEMRDRPLAIGLQEQIANHRKRLGSKALVVSVAEKAP